MGGTTDGCDAPLLRPLAQASPLRASWLARHAPGPAPLAADLVVVMSNITATGGQMVFIPHDQPVEVMLWMNGMVMVFNSAGEQLPDYQGRWTYALPKLLAQPTAKLITWKVGVWKEWLEPVTLEQVSTLARVFTVDGPMVEAAARAEHDFDRGANVVNLGWEETTSAMRDHCRTRAARGLDAALGLRR